MKKILLFATAFISLIAVSEKGSGKCEAHCDLTRSSGSYSISATTTNGKVYFFPGETITAAINFSGLGACGCISFVWYKDGNIVQQGGKSFTITEPGSYELIASNCSSMFTSGITWSFTAIYPFTESNWLYKIKAIDGTYTAHAGMDYYVSTCGIELTAYAEPLSGNPMTGFAVDWYLDSVYQFTKRGNVEFTQPGLIYYRVNPAYNFYCTHPLHLTLSESQFELLMTGQPEGWIGTSHDTVFYNVLGDHCLMSAYEKNLCSTKNIAAQWFLDNSYYASTLPGETLSVNHSGLITAVDTINNLTSRYKILLHGVKLHNANSPEILNLHYTIINMFGQEMEQGDAHDYEILRTKNAKQPLRPGIYFVIYSDVLDNRQVLTDKVFVHNY